MNPNRIGAIAETKIAAEAVDLGFEVLYPVVGGNGRYDLVFDLGDRLLRVQCKTARRRGDVIVVAARTSRRAPEGFRRTVYTPDEIDVIAAYCPELSRCFAVPIAEIPPSGCMSLRLARPRNGQRAGLHFADDYPLGAVAQLAERAPGRREAGGSNPPSSTPPDDSPTVIGAHEFRNRFGWYMERAAGGEPILITRRGKPHLRLTAATPQLGLVA
jgi:prevent-host-death family protein